MSVDFSPSVVDGKYYFAVGLENGALLFGFYENKKIEIIKEFDKKLAPAACINKLKF